MTRPAGNDSSAPTSSSFATKFSSIARARAAGRRGRTAACSSSSPRPWRALQRSASFAAAITRSASISGSSGSIAFGSMRSSLISPARGRDDGHHAAARGGLGGLLGRLLLQLLHLRLHLLRPASSSAFMSKLIRPAPSRRRCSSSARGRPPRSPARSSSVRGVPGVAELERDRELPAGHLVERVAQHARRSSGPRRAAGGTRPSAGTRASACRRRAPPDAPRRASCRSGSSAARPPAGSSAATPPAAARARRVDGGSGVGAARRAWFGEPALRCR